jgi:Transcriptional regulator PadR-like family
MDRNAASDTRITRTIIGALREHDLSAFELWQWLGPVPSPSGDFSEAAVFPTLHSLEEQGLLVGEWREDDSTRRKYRITATARALADKEGWGPIAFERFGPTRYSSHDGSDADRVGRRGDSIADEGTAGWNFAAAPARTPVEATPEERPPTGDESAATEAYLDAMQEALRLSPTYKSDACHEVGDYIHEAAARLEVLGVAPTAAVAEITSALGPPAELARAINDAQLTSKRLRRGMSWGSAVATLTFVVVFTIVYDAVSIFTPLVLGLLVPILKGLGLNVYAPPTPSWNTQAFGVGMAVAAFLAARRSMPYLADRSRQGTRAVWRVWALSGSIPLAVIVLGIPVAFDPLALTLLISAPFLWVLGTRLPALLYGPTATAAGLAFCALAVLLVTYLPGGRIWFYDTSAPAGGPSASSGVSAKVTWSSTNLPTDQLVSVDLPAGWHDAQVQLWPAIRVGLAAERDPSAAQPTTAVAAGTSIELESLPGSNTDWWVSVSAVAPDGKTYDVFEGLHYGYRSEPQSSILTRLFVRH